MISKEKTYAVIGASSNEEKYGYKVFKDLLDAGYKVIPINPKGGKLLGQDVYSKLVDYTEEVDVAIMVVPPEVGVAIVDDLVEKAVPTVWFQPGSESDQAIELLESSGVTTTSGACIMVERRT